MEKVLTHEMSKYLIILGVGVISLSVLMAKLITKLKGSFKPFKKSIIWYLLVSMLFFVVIALAAHVSIFSDPITFFIFYQAYFLMLGMVHFHLIHLYMKWSGDEKSFWSEFIFTIIVAMFGSICFIVMYRLLNTVLFNTGIFGIKGFELVMAISISLFIVPVFFYHAFRKAVAIPPKIIRQWQYPVGEEIVDPDESKMKNLLVISFEFRKQKGDRHNTNFRAKAPTDMEFGHLFYYFLNDYNERHPNSKIDFINAAGEPHEWIFFKKPRWYSIITQYIDTEKTIYINNVRENDVIICSRSLN